MRQRLPDGVELMADYNQALSVERRQPRPRLDQEGLAWIEEPIRHDDTQAAPAWLGN